MSDIEITRGLANVFEDLGFSPEESASLRVRSDLMLNLGKIIRERSWTVADAGAFFSETPARIRELLSGEVGEFSIDQLVEMLARVGRRVRLEILPDAA